MIKTPADAGSGYKEFANLNLDQEDPSSDPSFESMLDRMKLSTHQYAKSQIKWIRKQLLPAIKEARSLGGDVEVYVVRGGREGEELATGILDGQYWIPVTRRLT